jgi:broad specificity phosphatase PhoE
MNNIYFIRHGQVNKDTLMLNEDGYKFADDLIHKFKNKSINFLASSNEIRGLETILPLSKNRNLQINTYDKIQFLNLIPLQDSTKQNNTNSIICYRLEEVNPILIALKQLAFTDETRNRSYNVVIHITIENGVTVRHDDF